MDELWEVVSNGHQDGEKLAPMNFAGASNGDYEEGIMYPAPPTFFQAVNAPLLPPSPFFQAANASRPPPVEPMHMLDPRRLKRLQGKDQTARAERRVLELENMCCNLTTGVNTYPKMIAKCTNHKNELEKENQELRQKLNSLILQSQIKQAETEILDQEVQEMNELYNQQKLLEEQQLHELHQKQISLRNELALIKEAITGTSEAVAKDWE